MIVFAAPQEHFSPVSKLDRDLCVSPSDSELDQQLTGSELLLSALLQNTVQGSGSPDGLAVTSEGPYDFYQQPNTSEARLCLPVLEQLSGAVKQRLEDWPEHPALVQVSKSFYMVAALILYCSIYM